MRITLRRRLPRSSVVAFVLAAGCAAAAFLLVRGLAERAAEGGAGSGAGARIVIAARQVAPGTTLTLGDVAIGTVPGDAPPDALIRLDDAVGTVAVTPFEPGEAVVATRLATGGGVLTASIPEGQVALTLALPTVPDGLAPGDRVDVLATFTTDRPYTMTVASDARVLRVSVGGDALGAGADLVTLVLTPDLAREVAQAAATGAISLAVRGYEPVASSSPGV